jgi:hypothetical protein
MSLSNAVNIFSVNHLVLWFVIGYIFPHQYLLLIVVSLAWELLETVIVHQPVLYNLTKTYWFVPEKYWNETIENKCTDILFNTIGFYLGSIHAMRTRLNPGWKMWKITEAVSLAVLVFILSVVIAATGC